MDNRLSFLTDAEQRLWTEVRGWLIPAAAEELYRHASEAPEHGSVVEIGSFAGKSTICLARAIKDRSGTPMTAIDPMFQRDFTTNLEQFGVQQLVRPLAERSIAVADTWEQPVSFIYIDGDHGKAHAYADFVVWDTFVLPGGVVALDDTAGFFTGPSLQVQAALGAGAYEAIADCGGVTFLRKQRSLVPAIGDFPLDPGSRLSLVAYVSAWVGAMDPELRLPQLPMSQGKAPLRPSEFLDAVSNVTLRQLGTGLSHGLRRRGRSRHSVSGGPDDGGQAGMRSANLGNPERILGRLEASEGIDDRTRSNLVYLRACLLIQLLRPSEAVVLLEPLCDADGSQLILLYEIGLLQMALLRLAQALDLQGDRAGAEATYARVLESDPVPEVRHQAELGIRDPFRMPALHRPRMLREYVVDSPLAKYRSYT
jgi:predicted O-methyltransferase YrrM